MVRRAVTFGPGLALPPWTWAALGMPGHLAGLAAMTVLGLLAVPNVTARILLIPVAARQYAWVPRHHRIAYRRKHGRAGARSAAIPYRWRQAAYAADRHRCVMRRWWRKRDCRGGLQCDHRIPWAGGGLTIPANLFTLCRYHNGVKLNYSRDPDGYEHYAGTRSPANLAAARRILHAENLTRCNPLRGLRMAWALGG